MPSSVLMCCSRERASVSIPALRSFPLGFGVRLSMPLGSSLISLSLEFFRFFFSCVVCVQHSRHRAVIHAWRPPTDRDLYRVLARATTHTCVGTWLTPSTDCRGRATSVLRFPWQATSHAVGALFVLALPGSCLSLGGGGGVSETCTSFLL